MNITDAEAARALVLDFLRADAEYRRDLGVFGSGDYRVTRRETFLLHAKANLRAWYVANFGSDDLATKPE